MTAAPWISSKDVAAHKPTVYLDHRGGRRGGEEREGKGRGGESAALQMTQQDSGDNLRGVSSLFFFLVFFMHKL